jgi:hypothetical protein
VLGREGTALVDGTVCPVWDWNAIPDLYSRGIIHSSHF